jgi:hypothetical protein
MCSTKYIYNSSNITIILKILLDPKKEKEKVKFKVKIWLLKDLRAHEKG